MTQVDTLIEEARTLGLFKAHAPFEVEGIRLDRLTATQRRILRVLDIVPPWPELSAA
ncbi:MAG: hypothetical protein HYY42_01240 [Chloroflexi bacterium]|nr:hypothetical protein [Chloroflexota bacterium]